MAPAGDIAPHVEPGGTSIIAGQYTEQHIQGVPLERYQQSEKEREQLAHDLGVTRAAVDTFFKIIEDKNVPPAE